MTLRLTLISTFLLVAVLLISCEQATLPTRAPVAATTAPEKGTSPYPGSAAPAPASLQQTRAVSERATPAATATPAPWFISAHPSVPAELVAAAKEVVAGHPARFSWTDDPGLVPSASLILRMGPGDSANALAIWIYAVAVPFATVPDGTTISALQAAWRGEGETPPLLVPQMAALLQALWGAGHAATVPAEELQAALWAQRPAWTLVPFHQLVPSLKVWEVDGLSPLDADFAPATYPFTAALLLDGDPEAAAAFAGLWSGPVSNRAPEKITRVAMTGVTALVRATAYQMEIRGITYPGEEVAPVMQAADIAHVSNEVAFVPDCPMPHYIGGTTFCSNPRYMELLQFIGVDVVELTGNHVNDWGAGYIPYTLQLYENAGMQYFGGGLDEEAARQPAVFEHNGNHIVFLGCNPVGPSGAWAGPEWGGARRCDESFAEQIRHYSQNGAVVIATQQHSEHYGYTPLQVHRDDFAALAAAGAAAVSGSQAHHVHGFAFEHGAFIHYGLGNLFFDQMDQLGTRQTFVDVYTIYENRLLSVSLWTGLIENYARPRLMTPEERADLLQTVFLASGW
jgi:hypothetical protein